jgi:DNA-binding ferritin-like protein
MGDNKPQDLRYLAELVHCVAGDVKTIHVNSCGERFDDIHGITCSLYWRLSDDYDTIAEKCRELGFPVNNPNTSAANISYASVPPRLYSYNDGIKLIKDLLGLLIRFLYVFNEMYKHDLGIANFLQDMSEYYQKESKFKDYARLVMEAL